MTWSLTDRVWIGLVITALALSAQATTFPQATEPRIDARPSASKTNTNRGNSECETCRVRKNESYDQIYNDLRREVLDDRADNVYWWLASVTIILGFFAIVAVLGGYLGFRRFREIETEVKNSYDEAKRFAKEAKDHVEEIKRNRDKSGEIVRNMNAETADETTKETEQATERVLGDPQGFSNCQGNCPRSVSSETR